MNQLYREIEFVNAIIINDFDEITSFVGQLLIKFDKIWIILIETNVPSDAGHGGNRTELMDDVAWKKVNIIIIEWYFGVANSFTMQLIEFSIFNPLNALRNGWFVQIQL